MIKISEIAITKPKVFMYLTLALTFIIIGLTVTPSVSKDMAKYLHPISVDVDPENMLDAEDPERIFNKNLKEKFSLYDLVIVGVVNKSHKNGVFNVESLKNVYDLVEYSKTIEWKNDEGNTEGVISADLMAPSTMDNIEQDGPSAVKFERLMATAPATENEALAVREKLGKLPMLKGTLLSDDGKSLALYIPITSKGISYKVTEMLKEKIKSYKGSEEFFITGLPVAQDTFAVEMFKQMATTAPLAMVLIFILLLFFFKNIRLVIAPMIVAMVSVIVTMGLLIILGFDIHIMSSMVPIFIMPIAVLDAIHILSEFYDRYPEFKDRKKTIEHVMKELSIPMLYTTITTAIGFFSLNLTPLPPVQVFGTFVGIGVILAWLFTITLIPAYIMLMPEKRFKNFGMKSEKEKISKGLLKRPLEYIGVNISRFAKPIIALVVILFVLSGYGITKIIANDNPVKWFEASHEIRKSDRILNEMFGGTYMAYLALKSGEEPLVYKEEVARLKGRFKENDLDPLKKLSYTIDSLSNLTSSKTELITALTQKLEIDMLDIPEKDLVDWDNTISYLNTLQFEDEVFKDPEVLQYISGLQDFLTETGYVGKSNSIVEIVKTVHRELYSGNEREYRIPDTGNEIAQTLITFESSHRPQDLWHFITPDYKEANVWLQLRSGDNVDMAKVEELVDTYFETNPPPKNLRHNWFGLNHINVVWQDQIVIGMLKALIGSFITVLIIMSFLYRSILWGLLAMIPLMFSVAVLYGIVGMFNIDYNAPIAILSALILGLAVDYAIHFLTRCRQLYKEHGNWKDTSKAVFDEPARAIVRNVIIIGVGFLPLLISSLVPYQTTGIFISSILVFAGLATLLILPSLIQLLKKIVFKKSNKNETHMIKKIIEPITGE